MKYLIFKSAVRIAMWACVYGYTYDYLSQAYKHEGEARIYES